MTALALPAPLSGYRANDVGVLTHALIATVLPDLPNLAPYEVAQALMVSAGRLVAGTNVNRRRVLVSTAVSHAATYLRHATLVTKFTLLGCEWDTSQGRVDVAWSHSGGSIVFDEVKTTGQALRVLPIAWKQQAGRYASGGAAVHGPAFVGVRLIPCGSLHLAAMLAPDGTWQRVDDLAGVPGVTS